MGKVRQFYIQLEKQDGVFFAGNWINGQVVVHLAESLKMRGIHLAFNGGSHVHWTETETTGTGEHRKTETKHFTADETYFNQSVVLFGKSLGRMSGDNPVLPAGQYVYPFQFQLPHSLPSSFEHEIGHIRYQLKATIDMPWQFDHTTKRPFSVVGLLDLNLVHNARIPQGGSDEKMICCLCCASGPISAQLSLDRTGYVPGEYVTLSGQVINKSTRRISNIKISLQVRYQFHVRHKSKEVWKTVSEIRRHGITAEATDDFNGLSLHVPPLPPSFLNGCNIIDVNYVLKLIVDPAGPATDLEVPLEVIIGTIPLQNVHSSFVQNPYQPILYDQNAWIDAPPPYSPPGGGSVPSAPPPAYEECYWGRSNIREEGENEHTGGPREWAPAYPYYSWGNNPSAPPLPAPDTSKPQQPPAGGAYPQPGGAPYPQPGAPYPQPGAPNLQPSGAPYPQPGAPYPQPGGVQPSGAAYGQPTGSAYQPTGTAYQPAGSPYQPAGSAYQPAGAAYQPASAPHTQQPPQYAPPQGFAIPPPGAPPAGYAAPPPGYQPQPQEAALVHKPVNT